MLVALVFLFSENIVLAQNYNLDSSYGINGLSQIKSTDTFCDMYASGSGSVLENDGKITYIHHSFDPQDVFHVRPGVMRITDDGLNIDMAFGLNGVAQKPLLPVSNVSAVNHNIATSLFYEQDAGYIIGGRKKGVNFNNYTSYALKFTTNGISDNTFGNNSVYYDSSNTTFNVIDIKKQSNDGYLLMGLHSGDFYGAVQSITVNGKPDSNFGFNSFQNFSVFNTPYKDIFYKSVEAINGSYYISFTIIDSANSYKKERSGFIKLKPNGQPDSTFGTYGRVILSSYLQNKFIPYLGVSINGDFYTTTSYQNIILRLEDTATLKQYIAKFNTAGYLDTTFGQNGYALFSPPQNNTSLPQIFRLHSLSNNKIVVVGRTYDTLLSSTKTKYFVALYNNQGVLDTLFGQQGYYSLSDSIKSDGVFTGNILSLNENSFYVTGYNYDKATANYYDGYFLAAKFKSNSSVPNAVPLMLNNIKATIYPNPCTNFLDVNSHHTIDKVEIFSLYGKLVNQTKNNEKFIKLDLKLLTPATYNLRITTKSGNQNLQFIKN